MSVVVRAKNKTLPKAFYLQNADVVARELLGHVLVHETPEGRISGRIVETEAYLGVDDPAAHSFGDKRTDRIRSMYLEGGHAYVYFIYGMHFCVNVVTGAKDIPQAVLIRGIEPLDGVDIIRRRRRVKAERDLTNGPGKLCAALGIDRACDGLKLDRAPLYIEKGEAVDKRNVGKSPRIGVDYAGAAAAWPLRFFVKENAYVSKPPSKRKTH